ncbi:hypothetical protein [Phycicoccus sp. HDW14]|nr:hypothetical protein [Phycicoccus sp. HDW14]
MSRLFDLTERQVVVAVIALAVAGRGLFALGRFLAHPTLTARSAP